MSPPRPVARIPADVEKPDRILAGLTARQLGILAATFGLAAALVGLTHQLLPAVPLAVWIGLGAPLAAAGLALTFGQRDGLGLDRLALAALRQARAPKRLVAAPEGITAAPDWLTSHLDQELDHPRPAPLHLPAHAIDPSGVLDLGTDGAALLCAASPVNLALRTPDEQAVLVDSFGRFLHSLTGPAQVLLRAHPVDLRTSITQLRADAVGLPHPALETAAQQHATWLAELTTRHDALRRDLLVVLRDPTPNAARHGRSASLRRRAEQAAGLLAVAGVSLTVLDAPQATALLANPPHLPATGAGSGNW